MIALDIASWVCLVVGSVFCIVGAVGLLRFPDLYARTHGATITDTLGAGMILVGLMFQGGLSIVTVKLVLVMLLVLYTSPASSHALVKAAYLHGVRVDLPLEERTGGIPD
jgi:multicomponent Na+:H+ antiporter subunit G